MAYPPTAFGRSRRPSQKLDAGGMRVGSRGSLAAQLGIAACVALGGAAAFVVLDSDGGTDQPPVALAAAPEPAPVAAPAPAPAPAKSARSLSDRQSPAKVAATPDPAPTPAQVPPPVPPQAAAPNPPFPAPAAAPEPAPSADREVFGRGFSGADLATERLAPPAAAVPAPPETVSAAPNRPSTPVAMAGRPEPVQTNSVGPERVAPAPAASAPPGPAAPAAKMSNAGGNTPTDCLPKALTSALSEIGARFGAVTLISTTRLNSRNHAPGSARARMHEACMAVDFKVTGATVPVVAYLKTRGGLGGIEAYRDGVIHMDAPAGAGTASGGAGRRASARHNEDGESMDASDHQPIAIAPAPAAPAPARPPPVMTDR